MHGLTTKIDTREGGGPVGRGMLYKHVGKMIYYLQR